MSRLDPAGAARRVRAFLDVYGIPGDPVAITLIWDADGESTHQWAKLFAEDVQTLLGIAETLGDLNDLPTDQTVE
jgi:hypothetical protein